MQNDELGCQSQSNSDRDGGIQFYPPEFWGLDFQFHTFNKLYNRDILEMKEYPMFPGAFAYKNHPIYKVDVLGVVVKVEQNQSCFMYAVDDGTGCLTCCCWKNSFKTLDSPNTWNLPAELQSKVSQINTENEVLTEGYKIGDLVHVRGKLKIFRNTIEVVASYHNEITDPMTEVSRMAELPHLYRQRYDKPFRLPYKVAQAVSMQKEETRTGTKSEKRIVLELRTAVEKEYSRTGVPELDVQSLMRTEEIQNILSQITNSTCQRTDLVEQALISLQQDGKICHRSDKKSYFEVIKEGCMLEKTIMKILQKECTNPKCEYTGVCLQRSERGFTFDFVTDAEKGCHYLHIVDELHKTFEYSKVQASCVLCCLQSLEQQSVIIRTTQKHFLAFNI